MFNFSFLARKPVDPSQSAILEQRRPSSPQPSPPSEGGEGARACEISNLKFQIQMCAWLILACAGVQGAPIALKVDATDAPRKMLRAVLEIPASPGKLTLLYPKW